MNHPGDNPQGMPELPEPGSLPIEGEPMEAEQPRRAASARFTVEGEIGSQAALREAMDPANQSLADALRLSYRVLQVVILALVALFLVSGFKTVEKGQSGVMLRFGRIIPVGGEPALAPGLHHNFVPFPGGEFLVFNVEKRPVDVGEAFWPRIPQGMTVDQAVDRATTKSALRPGEDGTVLVADGDLAHLRISGEYDIIDPVKFVERVDDARNAGRIVQLALQRAAVHAAAGSMLQQLVDQPAEAAVAIRQAAQRTLDGIDCGVALADVQLPESRPPLAIVKAYGELQNAMEEARKGVERARQDAERTLIDTGGPDYPVLVSLIDRFEEADELGDGRAANELLKQINDFLESGRARGAVAETVLRAQAYASEITVSLGAEAQRFTAALAEYRRHPELATQRRWLDAYSAVVSRKDAEIFFVPPGLGRIGLNIQGLESIQKLRRSDRLEREERKANEAGVEILGLDSYRRAQDWELDKENPIMEIGPDGKPRPKGSDR